MPPIRPRTLVAAQLGRDAWRTAREIANASGVRRQATETHLVAFVRAGVAERIGAGKCGDPYRYRLATALRAHVEPPPRPERPFWLGLAPEVAAEAAKVRACWSQQREEASRAHPGRVVELAALADRRHNGILATRRRA
jgi:hypothetical protein